ncbi:MAG: (d)CMP kinase [Myxococcales bacterium]|jgi:cytidylate kinase
MSRKPVVAIDGPAGAGKSTVTKRVADELGYLLVDTGALYRTVALGAQRAGVSWDDPEALGKFAHVLVNERAVELAYQKTSGLSVKLRGADVSLAIRAPDVSQGASKVSAVPAVRDALLDMQRQAGAAGGAVLEGRDIGTVVFPDAEAKFYLTANVEIRARRRFDELLARGGSPDLAEVQREVAERDLRDSTRPIAPLKQAADAHVIDTTALSIDQVVARIVQRVREVEAELGARA